MARDWGGRWARLSWLGLAGSVLIAAAVTACKGTRDKREMTGDQGTRRDLVKKLHTATIERNLQEYLECWSGNEDVMDMVRASFAMGCAGFDFRDKLNKTYGLGAWDEFQHAETDVALSFVLASEDPHWADNVPIYQKNGDLFFDSATGPVKIIQEGKAYKIDLLGSLPAETNSRRFIEFHELITKILVRGTEEIGKPGVSVLSLKRSMGRWFTEGAEELAHE